MASLAFTKSIPPPLESCWSNVLTELRSNVLGGSLPRATAVPAASGCLFVVVGVVGLGSDGLLREHESGHDVRQFVARHGVENLPPFGGGGSGASTDVDRDRFNARAIDWLL